MQQGHDPEKEAKAANEFFRDKLFNVIDLPRQSADLTAV